MKLVIRFKNKISIHLYFKIILYSTPGVVYTLSMVVDINVCHSLKASSFMTSDNKDYNKKKHFLVYV